MKTNSAQEVDRIRFKSQAAKLEESQILREELISLQINLIKDQMKQTELLRRLNATTNMIGYLETKQTCQKDRQSLEVEKDQRLPARTIKRVQRKCEGGESIINHDYYHGPISSGESEDLLRECSAGTFLVRDSQDPRFFYSLSLQRGNSLGGVTSVRIHQDANTNTWRLDCETNAVLPSFPSVHNLVQYYMLHTLLGDSPLQLLNPLSRREQIC